VAGSAPEDLVSALIKIAKASSYVLLALASPLWAFPMIVYTVVHDWPKTGKSRYVEQWPWE
jgi:hypothetical protein